MGKGGPLRTEVWGPGLGHPSKGAVRSKTGCKRTPGWWHSAKDTFSARIPCQVEPEEPGDLTLAWRHRALGRVVWGGHPPAQPPTSLP